MIGFNSTSATVAEGEGSVEVCVAIGTTPVQTTQIQMPFALSLLTVEGSAGWYVRMQQMRCPTEYYFIYLGLQDHPMHDIVASTVWLLEIELACCVNNYSYHHHSQMLLTTLRSRPTTIPSGCSPLQTTQRLSASR